MSKLKYKAPRQLTYRQAAAETGRSLRAIHRWRKAGMPMGWRVKDGQRVRVVREDILFEWMRARLQSNPAHQYRMRKLLAEARIEDASEMQQHPGGGPSHPLGKERT